MRHRIEIDHILAVLVIAVIGVACDLTGSRKPRQAEAAGEKITIDQRSEVKPPVPQAAVSARPSTAKSGSVSFNLQSTLPEVVLELSQELDHVDKKPAVMTTLASRGGAAIDDHIAIGIRYRGNSSYKYYPKKQYSLEIKDKSYKDEGLGLVDLPSGNDWVLYAPYGDKSLVRNVLAYNLYNKLDHYAPKTRFVTMSLASGGGEPKKMGIYVLMEKIRVAASRLNIGKKGGEAPYSYLLRFDRLKDRNFVTTDKGHDVIVDYPSAKKWDEPHKKVLLDLLNDFERHLYSENQAEFLAAVDFVDIGSLVDFIIMQELGKNIDGYNFSCYFYIPAGGRLTFGPVWDFDIAFGNVDLYEGWMTEGFQFTKENDTNWFKKLASHPVIKQALKQRWNMLRTGALSESTLVSMIDEQVGTLPKDIIAENFTIWNILGVKVWPNYVVNPTYEKEVEALKTWIAARLVWLDGGMGSL